MLWIWNSSMHLTFSLKLPDKNIYLQLKSKSHKSKWPTHFKSYGNGFYTWNQLSLTAKKNAAGKLFLVWKISRLAYQHSWQKDDPRHLIYLPCNSPSQKVEKTFISISPTTPLFRANYFCSQHSTVRWIQRSVCKTRRTV